jgi:hypothetical protein
MSVRVGSDIEALAIDGWLANTLLSNALLLFA